MSLFLAHFFYTQRVGDVMQVSIDKQLRSFQICFGVLYRLCLGKDYKFFLI